jgi:hypothetical protein
VLAASINRALALMIEVASTSETSVNFDQITRRNNSEDSHLLTYLSPYFKTMNFPSIMSRIGVFKIARLLLTKLTNFL